MSVLRLAAAVVFLLAAVLVLGWLWLLHTSAGARFLWSQAESRFDGAVSAARLTGNLGSGVELEDIRFRNQSVDASAGVVKFAADVDLLPLSLRLVGVEIEASRIEAGSRESADDTPAGGLDEILARLELPFWVFIDDLAIRDLELEWPGAAVQIDTARLRGAWRDRIRIDELLVTTPEDTAAVSGRLVLRPPFAVQASGDVATRRAFVGVDDVLSARFNVEGDLSGFAIGAESRAALTGFAPLDIGLSGDGSRESLALGKLAVNGADLDATGTADIRWNEALRVAASIDLAHANPHALLESWPAGHPVSGMLSVEYAPGRLRISDSRLQVRGTQASVDLDANVDTATGEVTGELAWQHLSWPVDRVMPDIWSRAGSVRIAGTPDAWRVVGRLELEALGVEDGSFRIDGAGDREKAAVTIDEAKLFGGRVRGFAEGSWVGQRAWSASLDLDGIDTRPLVPDWPAVISGHVDASGRAAERAVNANLENLRGTLRGRAFEADGGIAISGENVVVRELALEHGTSRLVIDGDLSATQGLAFSFESSNIGEWIADASGDLQASGVVSRRKSSPYLRLEAASERLSYGDLTVNALRVTDAAADGEPLRLEIVAADFSAGGEAIAAPRLMFAASAEQQALEFAGVYRDFAFDLGARGSLQRWAADADWRGELSTLVIASGEEMTVSLTEPVALSVSKKHVAIERMCMSEPGNSRFCADIAWNFGQRIDLAADVADIPVDLVNGFGDTGFTFDQLVTGRVRWQQRAGQRATGDGDISMSPGSIRSRDRPELVVATETGRLAFDIDDGKLLSGVLRLPMPGTGSIDGVFSVFDVTDIATSPVTGHLDLAMQDIALIALLLPLVDVAQGRMEGTIDVSGTFGAPLLSGSVALQGGSVEYLPLGLRLDELELTSTLDAEKNIDVTGTFRAGRGRGEILTPEGISVASRTALRLKLRGNELTIIDVPDLRAVADLDVDIAFADETVTLGGKILVPHARVRPKNLVQNKRTVSDDVVIVAGRLPDTETNATAAPVPIRGLLELTLGNDVAVDLDLAKATLNGTATFVWSGDPMPVANGRYAIAGDIEAFGQVLTVVEGGIRFPSVPANNPTLRVRAEREIFGNSQIKAAGVLVTGTIARPALEAYTYPASTEERALTLLVTGSDFNYDQGVGAVAFGTYVAPKLFLSYGVGLFGRDNVISARYDLASGFGIKATSGQQESGIDFIYRFER